MKKVKCPNPACNGFDNVFYVDDIVHHTCDKCGTTWDTYNVKGRVERAINIKITKKCSLHYFIPQGNTMVCEKCGLIIKTGRKKIK